MDFLNFPLGTHIPEGTWWYSTGYIRAWIVLRNQFLDLEPLYVSFSKSDLPKNSFANLPFLSLLDSVPSSSLQSQVSSCLFLLFLGFLDTLSYNVKFSKAPNKWTIHKYMPPEGLSHKERGKSDLFHNKAWFYQLG